MPFGVAPAVTVTRTATPQVTASATKTVTERPAEPAEDEVGTEVPDDEGFYMPDFVGLTRNDVTDYMFYEYGLYSSTDYEILGPTYCQDGWISDVRKTMPAAGTWVAFSETSGVRIYVGCD